MGNYTISELHGWQDQVTGVSKLINTSYKNNTKFKFAVDMLLNSGLTQKDIKRVSQVACMVMIYPHLMGKS